MSNLSARDKTVLAFVAVALLAASYLAPGDKAKAPEPAPAMSVEAAERLRMQGSEGDDDKTCHSSKKQRDAAALEITLAGYDCKVANSVCPYLFSEGFSVACNNNRYTFEVENHGGRWSVKAN